MLDMISRFNARLLYLGARHLYRSEMTHSQEMKHAFEDQDAMSRYRSAEFQRVVSAAKQFGVNLENKTVLDLGCNDGAISTHYIEAGAAEVIGVDIDEAAIRRAQELRQGPRARFLQSDVKGMPQDDDSVDVIISYDVFEHLAQPRAMLAECRRVLRPGGKMLIGTWGWGHPFAPHLWAVMPVPWAHVFVSERTLLRACRLVYQASWYVPNMYDFDEQGNRLPDKYRHESIPLDYLNKFWIKDFERVFRESGLEAEFHLLPFGSRFARWTRPLLRAPYLREFFTGYLWIVAAKPGLPNPASRSSTKKLDKSSILEIA
jgi:2-polyprenyl-3-methyl-5-hydroxy-6-metoxy-1,4-benzoquinol methylase